VPQRAAEAQAVQVETINGGSHTVNRTESPQAPGGQSAGIHETAELSSAKSDKNEWPAPVIPENRWVPASQPESQADNVIEDIDTVDVFPEATGPEAADVTEMESVVPIEFEEDITSPSQEITQPEAETEVGIEPDIEESLNVSEEFDEADIPELDEETNPTIIRTETPPMPKTFIGEQFTPVPEAKVSFDVTPQDIETAAAASQESIRAMFDEVLEPLEPEAAQTATQLVDQVAEILTRTAPAAEGEPAASEELEEALEQLFAVMDIPCDEETLVEFISSIRLEDPRLTSDNIREAIADPGTHEKKIFNYLIIRNLSLMTQKNPSHIILGRYAINYGAELLVAA
jgi:hypothetical protein